MLLNDAQSRDCGIHRSLFSPASARYGIWFWHATHDVPYNVRPGAMTWRQKLWFIVVYFISKGICTLLGRIRLSLFFKRFAWRLMPNAGEGTFATAPNVTLGTWMKVVWYLKKKTSGEILSCANSKYVSLHFSKWKDGRTCLVTDLMLNDACYYRLSVQR